MAKYGTKILVLIGIFCFTDISVAQQYAEVKLETVIQHEVAEYHLTDKESKMLHDAKEVVKRYWITPTYEAEYNLYSESYKNMLRRTGQIDNAIDYKNSKQPDEFYWMKQIYIKSWIEDKYDKKQKGFFKIVKIAVLAEWEEEGYEGIYLITFGMVKEGSEWKIENIVRCGGEGGVMRKN